MMQICRCAKCNKELGYKIEEWHDKFLFIHLEIERKYDMCNECKNSKGVKYFLYFCSVPCLKDYVANDLDKYVEDEVYWGKLLKQMADAKSIYNTDQTITGEI